MYYVSAQPSSLYFAWQVETVLHNFLSEGIPADRIHVVSSNRSQIEWLKLRERFPGVGFFMYPDRRRNRSYASTIRPHLLSQHFDQYDELLHRSTVFYHDSDIILRPGFDFSRLEGDESTWYMSDARSYVGAAYLQSKPGGLYEEMCAAVGMDPAVPVANQEVSGGAQYIMRNLSAKDWDLIGRDSQLLFDIGKAHAETYPDDGEYRAVQYWTADMWALLWHCWRRGMNSELAPELDFMWPRSSDNGAKIVHNAGVMTPDEGLFFKQDYRLALPYGMTPEPTAGEGSRLYHQAVEAAGAQTCLSEETKIYER